MKLVSFVIAIASTSLLITSCQSETKKNPEASTTPSFTNDMRGMQSLLEELLPLVADPRQYNDPQNDKVIRDDVQHLVKLSKSVQHDPASLKKDPSITFISEAFNDEVERVHESLLMGRREYARYSLLNVSSYCIECHTRTSTGVSFQTSKLDSSLKNLNSFEKAEYLLATRQFEPARKEFISIIESSLKSGDGLKDLDRAVRYGLTVSVRFMEDPDKAAEIIKPLMTAKKTPLYLKKAAEAWHMSIEEWKRQRPVKLSNPSQALKQISDLVKRADSLRASGIDQSGDVYYLRAISKLHILLSTKLNKQQQGQALFLTGKSYEAVKDFQLWTLHENYFEACIKQSPNTSWSKQCYKSLEESVTFGFTGSSGTEMPPDVRARLARFKELSGLGSAEKPSPAPANP